MNRETIERLAIDSAAGELNEDAEALFQFYLAGNPQAKRWAEDVRLVYDETEAAIQTKAVLAGGQKAAPPMTPVKRVNRLTVARWAAAIILGTILGFTAGRWEATDKTNKMALREPALNPMPVETIADLKEKYVGTFWGDKMLALLDNTARRQHKAHLRDIRSWDTYRQYMKEKHHE
jgi:hypothetical protein